MDSPKTYTHEEALKRMERYCAYQERCHKEVRQKLYDLQIPVSLHDEIISELIQTNFLNETRFATAFARGKFKTKKWGKVRIINELRFREISQYNVQMALKEIDNSTYYKTFDLLSEKRFQQLESEKNIQNKKRKFRDYLMYRGWESNMIYEKMNELFK